MTTVRLIIISLLIGLSSGVSHLHARETVLYPEIPGRLPLVPGNLGILNIPDSIRLHTDLKKSDRLKWVYPDSAMGILHFVFHRSLSLNNYDLAAAATIRMGLVSLGKGDFDSCFFHYRNALFYISRARNRNALLSKLFINIGATYFYQENYEKALSYYYAILQFMLKSNPDDLNIVMAYNNIADVFMHIEQYDKASYYLDMAEKTMHTRQPGIHYAYIWVNKAEVALARKEYKQTADYAGKAQVAAKKYSAWDVEQAAHIIKARNFLARKAPQQAIAELNKALHADPGAYTYYSVIMPYYTLGVAYDQSGDYVNAEKALKKALATAQESGISADRIKALTTLASIYEKTGRYKEALLRRDERDILKDSLQSREKLKMANELEIKFRTAEKDKMLARKELLIAQQHRALEHKNMQVLLVAGTLIIFTILAIAVYRNFKSRHRINTLKAKMEGEEKERSRIARELHDGIGGMLAVIKMRLSSGDEELQSEVMSYLNETSEQIRKTAHNLMPDVVTDFTLKEALTMYAETLNRAYPDLRIDMQIHSELDIREQSAKLSIYRMLQEILQNIITHAKATLAIIQIFEQNGKLHLLIEDNGIGFDYRNVKKGLGLVNLETRVRMLNGYMQFNSSPGMGTTINIEFDRHKAIAN